MDTQVTSKDTIMRRVLEARDVLASLGVRSIGLFGSFVRGQQQPDSDVDILVEFTAEKHTFDNFMEVSFFLEKLLGRKVDLLTPEALSPHIGPYILREVERVSIAVRGGPSHSVRLAREDPDSNQSVGLTENRGAHLGRSPAPLRVASRVGEAVEEDANLRCHPHRCPGGDACRPTGASHPFIGLTQAGRA